MRRTRKNPFVRWYRAMLEARGLTLPEAAERVGVEYPNFHSKLMKAPYKLRVSSLQVLAKALGMSTAQMLAAYEKWIGGDHE